MAGYPKTRKPVDKPWKRKCPAINQIAQPVAKNRPRAAHPNGTSALDKLAKAKDATPGQVALAWLLKRSSVILPIPGTSKVKHLEENVAAAALNLTDEEFASLDRKRR